MVLNELEHDVALRGIGVEALITLLIVLLVKNDFILALGNFQVVGSTVHTQRIGFHASRDASLGQGVGMDGDKKICLITIGNIGTGMQGNENIRFTGINNLHIRAVAFNQSSKSQCNIQVDDFLLCNGTYSTSIIATMSGINNQCELICFCYRSVISSVTCSNSRHCQ